MTNLLVIIRAWGAECWGRRENGLTWVFKVKGGDGRNWEAGMGMSASMEVML